MDRLHQLQARGTSILLVTHDGMLVKRFCNRAIWLDQGRIRAIGASSPVVDEYLTSLFQIENPVEQPCTPPERTASRGNMEEHIANIDRRLGDQRCQVIGARLYDAHRNPIDEVRGGSDVILRFTVANVSLTAETPLVFGYIVRNMRGEEIASTNTRLEHMAAMSFASMHERLTVEARIHIPLLYPGHYSLSVGASYTPGTGVPLIVADRIVNALIFNVSCHKEICTPIYFDTTFSIDRVP